MSLHKAGIPGRVSNIFDEAIDKTIQWNVTIQEVEDKEGLREPKHPLKKPTRVK
jgi:hypothetical protein